VGTKDPQKAYLENFLNCINSILDLQDAEVIAVRGKNCKVIFANAKAEARIALYEQDGRGCKAGFSKSLMQLCEHCPHGKGKTDAARFEVEGAEGKIYSVSFNAVNWIDGKPVSLFVLRDVTQDKEMTARLHTLAYSDH
jgi:hypothetical protein